jgi:signal peptidase I
MAEEGSAGKARGSRHRMSRPARGNAHAWLDSAARLVRKDPEAGSQPAMGGEDDFKYILADSGAPGRPGGGPRVASDPERVAARGPGITERDGAGGSPARPDSGEPAARGRKPRSFWRELPVLVVTALAIALVIKTFVVQAFFIPSSSMENTLDIGDKVLVNKLVYHFRPVEPGDIIVFNGDGSWEPEPTSSASSDPVVRLYDATLDPLFHAVAGLFGTAPGQTDFIKRVIGVPGDHVACCNAAGDVTVNGVALREQSYLFPGNPPSMQRFSVTVPPGRLWVMGDHRSVSWDSRGHMQDPGGGTIPENMVIGRAFMIVWPPGRWRILQIPVTFGQPGISASAASGVAGASGASGASGAAGRAGASGASGAAGTAVAPAAPYLPLEAGFAAAVPLTVLQRRLRRRGLPWRRLRGRMRRR